MRHFVFAAALGLLPFALPPVLAPAWAQAQNAPDPLALSRQIGAEGITRSAASLAALPAPTPQELFALAGLRFLGGVEAGLQIRWRTGIDAEFSELPILRLPIPENPEPSAFKGADITELLIQLRQGMQESHAALAQLGAAEFGLEIDLADLWFDINKNDRRDPGEDIASVAGLALGIGPEPDWQESDPANIPGASPEAGGEEGAEAGAEAGTQPAAPPALVIRFDTADAAWLSAYGHLLSGLAHVAQAYDPAPAIDGILAATTQLNAYHAGSSADYPLDTRMASLADRIAMVLDMLAQTPDPALTQAALQHFQSMIADNRRFWALVQAETDNAREWIPNEAQTAALGITLPKGTAARWQAVLTEAEQLLEGKLLIPHWRFGAQAGINLKQLFESPPPVDLVGMIQGRALLPYAQKGPQISGAAWADFEAMLGGDALLFAVLFN